MDPDAAKDQLYQAIADNDKARARELRAALREWRAKGGFPPKGGWPRGV
jgi:hypothetical protein